MSTDRDASPALFKPAPAAARWVRCRHQSSDGREFGWDHHAGPHSCDYGLHGGQCPWRSQNNGTHQN